MDYKLYTKICYRTKNRLYKTYLMNPTDKNEQVNKNIKIN